MQFVIPPKIQRAIINNQRSHALIQLSKLIDNLDHSIFTPIEQDHIRLINSYRIFLLQKWGMYRDCSGIYLFRM